jgi:hypothetical protein
MNTQKVKRFLLGLLSSLLLAAGFAHAADRIDPVSLALRGSAIQSDGPTDPCVGDDGDDGYR